MTLGPLASLTPDDLATATWEEIRALYDDLAARPLPAAEIERWLAPNLGYDV